MNYIKRLLRENDEMRNRLDGIMQEIQEFRRDGSRMDWISAKDVDHKMQEIHSIAMNGYPHPIKDPYFTKE